MAAALLLLGPSEGAAQSGSVGLADLLPDLILREITLATSSGAVFTHAAHFSPLTSQDLENPAVGIVRNFNTELAVQLSTFPIGSSAGGFTYAFDPELGTFRRASRSFGPAFAERASTIGRRRVSAGFNYQHTTFDRFENRDLDDGSIKFYLRHEECCGIGGPPGPPFFGTVRSPDGSRLTPYVEGDVIEAALSLDATTDTFAFFATYGVTDRWDIGLAVPVVRVNLEATVDATIMRLATSSDPTIHTFESGVAEATTRSYHSAGTASGLGDIVVRTKYRLTGGTGPAAAAAVDLRLATGDRDNLLGAGTQTKVFFIGSAGSDRFGEHVNLGYTFSGGETGGAGALASLVGGTNVPDEFNYTAGIEYAPESRITIVADLIGRTLRDIGRLTPELKTFQYQTPVPTTPTPSVQFEEFEVGDGNLNLLVGTAGLKFNPTGNLLISAHLLFPLSNAGLRTKLGTVIGVDYAF
jgi:hypothetical protein